jgi:hypothetical protein
MIRAFQQIVFVGAHCRQPTDELGCNIDVAGGTGTTATTQGEQFIDARISDYLHHAQAILCFDSPTATFTVSHDDLRQMVSASAV